MATCLATSTLATVDMTVRYTDNMIDGMCDNAPRPLPPSHVSFLDPTCQSEGRVEVRAGINTCALLLQSEIWMPLLQPGKSFTPQTGICKFLAKQISLHLQPSSSSSLFLQRLESTLGGEKNTQKKNTSS